ncbi:hypothetical protein CSKR_114457 [Clonorchis sinensis]|uniref:Uncharacterized protein n=1 Tax=Clonorchis sinensis TaxID=79923 RepID=A0A3R7CBQ1_CLOSI|nr:hypothetical protein CSKR_114457 [Clonorchis sinensis]
MSGTYASDSSNKLHQTAQYSRMRKMSVGTMPFDWRWFPLSVLFLQNLTLAQNHRSHESGLEEGQTEPKELATRHFVLASTSTISSVPENHGISFEQSVTSGPASKPTERGDRNSVHRCPVCEKTFQYKGRLKQHQISHTDYHGFQCSLCSNVYKYPSDLRAHMGTIHSTVFARCQRTSTEQMRESHEAGNPCRECKKLFKTWRCLQQHQQLIHKGTGWSVCEECGKTFTQKNNLYSHIRTVHRKLGHFTCSQCGKSVRRSTTLKRHIKTVHKFAPEYDSLS